MIRTRHGLMATALLAALSIPGTADARGIRIRAIPVPHFHGSRDEGRSDDGQRLEEPHASVTLDENGKPVSDSGIDWLPILLVLGGAALSITMVGMALRPRG